LIATLGLAMSNAEGGQLVTLNGQTMVFRNIYECKKAKELWDENDTSAVLGMAQRRYRNIPKSRDGD